MAKTLEELRADKAAQAKKIQEAKERIAKAEREIFKQSTQLAANAARVAAYHNPEFAALVQQYLENPALIEQELKKIDAEEKAAAKAAAAAEKEAAKAAKAAAAA